MTPRLLLLYVSLGIIVFNILAVRYRARKTLRFEAMLRELSKKNGGEITVKDISVWLHIPLYDAKILARKLVSKERVNVKDRNGSPVYKFKTRH